jgi:hypothetical protein
LVLTYPNNDGLEQQLELIWTFGSKSVNPNL